MLGKFQELIIVEEHHRVHCVAFQLEHMLEILLKKNPTKQKKRNNNNNKTQKNVMYHSCHHCLKKKAYKSHFSRWYKSLLKTYFNSTYAIFSLSREVAEETHFPFLRIYKYDLGGGEKGKNYPSILFFLSKCS